MTLHAWVSCAPSRLAVLCAACVALLPKCSFALSVRINIDRHDSDISTASLWNSTLSSSILAFDDDQSTGAVAAAVAAKHVRDQDLQRELSGWMESFISLGCAHSSSMSTEMCVRLLNVSHDLVRHQDMAAEKLALYRTWVNRTSDRVLTWRVDAAEPGSTDKVAVIVLLQGDQDSYVQNNVGYVVRSVMKRLGPQWALQVFYGRESQKQQLFQSLGNPAHVIWAKATLGGQEVPLTRDAYNKLRWSTDFFDALHPKHEHILLFELDSMLLRTKCADTPQLLSYDMVGAAGCTSTSRACRGPFPPQFVNGGFTLRRRSTMLQAVKAYPLAAALSLDGHNPDEDSLANAVFRKMGFKIAPEDVGMHFSMEQIAVEAPCGFHKPWLYSAITPPVLQAALDAADL